MSSDAAWAAAVAWATRQYTWPAAGYAESGFWLTSVFELAQLAMLQVVYLPRFPSFSCPAITSLNSSYNKLLQHFTSWERECVCVSLVTKLCYCRYQDIFLITAASNCSSLKMPWNCWEEIRDKSSWDNCLWPSGKNSDVGKTAAIAALVHEPVAKLKSLAQVRQSYPG
jgi:hypothetical protein